MSRPLRLEEANRGRALADLAIYVIDVAEGEKIPRKGGPGITRSDLLVINQVDLARYVGASLDTAANPVAVCVPINKYMYLC